MAMLKLGEKIVSARVVILILSLVLLIPAAYGYIKTRVNYDILSYLPKDIETMEGQDILVDQFGTGAVCGRGDGRQRCIRTEIKD